jgi:hypothetical protein
MLEVTSAITIALTPDEEIFENCVDFFLLTLWRLTTPIRGRTAPLTSKVAYYTFIQQIQVQNILNMVYTLRFFIFKIQFVS